MPIYHNWWHYTIFPVVFAINSAYARREQGLVISACKGFMNGFYRIAADHPKDLDPENLYRQRKNNTLVQLVEAFRKAILRNQNLLLEILWT